MQPRRDWRGSRFAGIADDELKLLRTDRAGAGGSASSFASNRAGGLDTDCDGAGSELMTLMPKAGSRDNARYARDLEHTPSRWNAPADR